MVLLRCEQVPIRPGGPWCPCSLSTGPFLDSAATSIRRASGTPNQHARTALLRHLRRPAAAGRFDGACRRGPARGYSGRGTPTAVGGHGDTVSLAAGVADGLAIPVGVVFVIICAFIHVCMPLCMARVLLAIFYCCLSRLEGYKQEVMNM